MTRASPARRTSSGWRSIADDRRVGVGNAWRGDDAAGLELVRRIAAARAGVEIRAIVGDASGLLDAWVDHEHVALVDAAVSAIHPGTVHAFRADREPLPAAGLRSSTHAFGVADAVELARALGRLPAHLDVYAVEGADFAIGAGLSAPVLRAVAALAEELARAAAITAPRTTTYDLVEHLPTVTDAADHELLREVTVWSCASRSGPLAAGSASALGTSASTALPVPRGSTSSGHVARVMTRRETPPSITARIGP